MSAENFPTAFAAINPLHFFQCGRRWLGATAAIAVLACGSSLACGQTQTPPDQGLGRLLPSQSTINGTSGASDSKSTLQSQVHAERPIRVPASLTPNDGVALLGSAETVGAAFTISDVDPSLASQRVDRAAYSQEARQMTDREFPDRTAPVADVVPQPLGYGLGDYERANRAKNSRQGYNDWDQRAGVDEYVYDGSDRGKKFQVDSSWNMYGLDLEDTVGHFDTLDGQRLATPSNRVAIYAPRFAAVRRVDGVFNAQLNTPVGAYEDLMPLAQARGQDFSSSSKQNLAVTRAGNTMRASGLIDRTRGVNADNVTILRGARSSFKGFEDLALMRTGRFSNAETARLRLGMQAATVWEDDLGLQVATKKISPIIVRDIATVQQLVHVESEDGQAILSVTKIASRIAARPGEFVDFTIRFDNLSAKKIGNVTIMDNLTSRLEYVEDSAECSLTADFVNSVNDGGSLLLRWEITEPIEAHQGGIIRFRCRVR